MADGLIHLKRLANGLYKATLLGRVLAVCKDWDGTWFIREDGASLNHKTGVSSLRLCRAYLADMQSRPEKYWPPDCAIEMPDGKTHQARLLRIETPQNGPTQYAVEYFTPLGCEVATVGRIYPVK